MPHTSADRGQIEAKLGPLAAPGLDAQLAAVLVREPVRDRQPEPGALITVERQRDLRRLSALGFEPGTTSARAFAWAASTPWSRNM